MTTDWRRPVAGPRQRRGSMAVRICKGRCRAVALYQGQGKPRGSRIVSPVKGT